MRQQEDKQTTQASLKPIGMGIVYKEEHMQRMLSPNT